jgi:hypothetical protein
MNSWPTKFLIVITVGVGVTCVVPVGAQTLKKEPDPNQLPCGQKVLVENNTCPADQILEVTGSCLTRHPRLMWCEPQEGRNTTVSSESGSKASATTFAVRHFA